MTPNPYYDYALWRAERRASLYKLPTARRLFVQLIKSEPLAKRADGFGAAFRRGYGGLVKSPYLAGSMAYVAFMAGRFRRQLETEGFLEPLFKEEN